MQLRWQAIDATWKVITLPASRFHSTTPNPRRCGWLVRLKLNFITSRPLEMETTLPFLLPFLLVTVPLALRQLSRPQMTPKMHSSTSRPLEKGMTLLSSLPLLAILVHIVLRWLRGIRKNLLCPAKRKLLRSVIDNPTRDWEEPT